MSIDRSRVQVGMQVVANRGVTVGRVVALDTSNFIVERPDLPTIALSYSEIAGIDGNQLRVPLDASRVDKHGNIVPEHGFRPLGQQGVRPGMEVLGMDGGRIGQVVDAQADYITVDDGLTTAHYYIPSSAIEAVSSNQVIVAGVARSINRMGWDQPPATGNVHTFTIQPGMEVVGSDGDRVGAVTEAGDHYFTVQRDSAPDFTIPYAGVQAVADNRVTLNLPAEEVHEFGWLSPKQPRPAQVPGQPVVREGMEVVGTDGDQIGVVKATSRQEFVVQRRAEADLHVPYSYVRDATVDRVVLSVPRASVPFLNWESATSQK